MSMLVGFYNWTKQINVMKLNGFNFKHTHRVLLHNNALYKALGLFFVVSLLSFNLTNEQIYKLKNSSSNFCCIIWYVI